MKNILKLLIKYILVLIVFILIYEVFNKDVDLFNWYMGALFETIYFIYLKNGD